MTNDAGNHEAIVPSQSDVFAASQPFTEPAGPAHAAAHEPFLGVDAFNATGPVPLTGPLPESSLRATCLDVHRSLSVYLDGELALPQKNAVQAHMAVCGPCQSAQAFQMQFRSTLAMRALEPMPEDVRARITKALGFE